MQRAELARVLQRLIEPPILGGTASGGRAGEADEAGGLRRPGGVVVADAVGERGYVPPEGEGPVARGAEAGIGAPREQLPRHAGIDVGGLRIERTAVVERLGLERIADISRLGVEEHLQPEHRRPVPRQRLLARQPQARLAQVVWSDRRDRAVAVWQDDRLGAGGGGIAFAA